MPGSTPSAPASGAPSQRSKYIVMERRGAPPGSTTLPEFAALIGADPGIGFVRAIGATDCPDAVVIEASDDRAARLQRDFGASLIISRDEPVEPIPEPGPIPPG